MWRCWFGSNVRPRATHSGSSAERTSLALELPSDPSQRKPRSDRRQPQALWPTRSPDHPARHKPRDCRHRAQSQRWSCRWGRVPTCPSALGIVQRSCAESLCLPVREVSSPQRQRKARSLARATIRCNQQTRITERTLHSPMLGWHEPRTVGKQ